MKKGDNEKEGLSLEQLEPLELQYLNKIVSLVHETVNVSSQNQFGIQDFTVSEQDNQENKGCSLDLLTMSNDPFAAILYKMNPLTLCNVFLAMVVGWLEFLPINLENDRGLNDFDF